MQRETVDRLRELRRRADALKKTARHDLEMFHHAIDRVTFRRLPSSESILNDVGVTTSCSCLMALAVAPEASRSDIQKALELVFRARWESSGLEVDNGFTTAIVMRTAGILRRHGLLPDGATRVKRQWRGADSTFEDIARLVAEKPGALGLASGSGSGLSRDRPTSTVGYWFVDGIDGLDLDVPLDELVRWATEEFHRQRVRVAARNDALMDPVSLGMAACLVQRLHARLNLAGKSKRLLESLPTSVEVWDAVEELFRHQLPSGIWNKYFPLFNYKGGGSNYCFSFELLEAVLHEFGSREAAAREFGPGVVLERPTCMEGFERAITWCERTRCTFHDDKGVYEGWNAGHQAETLQRGEPESWATGTVYMFLHELSLLLSDLIQKHLLLEYRTPGEAKSWDTIIDAPVIMKRSSATSVKAVLAELIDEIGAPTKDSPRPGAVAKIPGARSVLLFGPPGTSKTMIVRSLAKRLGWPYVEITPSNFLRDDLSGIYSRSSEIFDDLMDLSGCVVLLDEMDSLVAERGTEPKDRLDVTRELLTTSLLPKLSALHSRARILLFMNTNHQQGLDAAIKRPGRFDLLLCVGPPLWKDKLANLKACWRKLPNDRLGHVRTELAAYASAQSTTEVLDRFTVDELTAFLVATFGSAGDAFSESSKPKFAKAVREWESIIELGKGKPMLGEFNKDKKASRRQVS